MQLIHIYFFSLSMDIKSTKKCQECQIPLKFSWRDIQSNPWQQLYWLFILKQKIVHGLGQCPTSPTDTGGHVSVTVGTVPVLPWAVCVHKNHGYHIAVTQHFASNLSNTGPFVCLTRSNPETKAVVQPEGYETLPDIHVHTYMLSQRNLWPLPCSLMSTEWDHYIFT